MPATRRFMSFIVVRLGFMWRGLEGLPTPLCPSMFPFVLPLARGVPPSAFCEPLLGAGEDFVGSGWAGGSRSLVYWFLPTRPLRAGGRPVFLWDGLGGGWSGTAGVEKEVGGSLAPRAETVRGGGSGVTEPGSNQYVSPVSINAGSWQEVPCSRPVRPFLLLASPRSFSRCTSRSRASLFL